MFKTFLYQHSASDSSANDSGGMGATSVSDEENSMNHEMHDQSSRILITYEHELMPDLKQEYENVIENDNNHSLSIANINEDIQYANSASANSEPSFDIFEKLQKRSNSLDTDHLLDVGVFLLIYSLAIEILLSQDEIVEFFLNP